MNLEKLKELHNQLSQKSFGLDVDAHYLKHAALTADMAIEFLLWHEQLEPDNFPEDGNVNNLLDYFINNIYKYEN